MPSNFDDFSEKAHEDCKDASPEEISNHQLLRAIIEKHGFKGIRTEWWHFDLIGWENYPTIDISPK